MSEQTKLTLSADELAMVQDRDIILTKRAVIEKAAILFSSVVPEISGIFNEALRRHNIPVNALPKISKGENYNGFPYVILDYPALFEKENIFAVRTMFWWGHFISITLHLSGKYKIMFAENSLANTPADLFIAIGKEEWEHYFDADNYIPALSLTGEHEKIIIERDFLKVAMKFDLKDWNMMIKLLPVGYKQINELLISF